MKVKIVGVHNHGDFKKEYVLLRVLEDCDIGEHMLADNTYTQDGIVSNKVRHTYWFPDKEVKKGELVSVWTRKGSDTEAKNDNDTTIHRFFWGLSEAIWNDDGDCALLFHIDSWTDFEVKSTK